MLSYDDFKQAYYHELQKELAPSGIDLQDASIQKINGAKDALVITMPGITTAPTIYYEDAYRQHQNHGTSVKELTEIQAAAIRKLPASPVQIPNLTPEEARTRLYAILINKEKNEDLLMDVPHQVVADDLAIVARYQTGENASFVVKSDLCGILKMTPEEILEIARKNTREKGFVCRPMGDVLEEMMGGLDMPADYKDDLRVSTDGPDLLVLTNHEKIEGAILGTDKEIMSAIHEALGKDFYVLPSSRHELLIVPESLDVDPETLEQMVHDVNRMEVSAEDFLSDHIYHFGPAPVLQRVDTSKVPEMPEMGVSKAHSRSK